MKPTSASTRHTDKTTSKLRHAVAVFSATIIIALAGCASVGQNFDDSKVSRIEKGVTTEADLNTLFGAPTSRSVNSEAQTILMWTYVESSVTGKSFIPYAGAFVGGNRSRNKTLTVTLADGKVVGYTYTGGGLESRGHKQDVPKK
jgi:hypothetical protein